LKNLLKKSGFRLLEKRYFRLGNAEAQTKQFQQAAFLLERAAEAALVFDASLHLPFGLSEVFVFERA